jgi:hypothetical protein
MKFAQFRKPAIFEIYTQVWKRVAEVGSLGATLTRQATIWKQ